MSFADPTLSNNGSLSISPDPFCFNTDVTTDMLV